MIFLIILFSITLLFSIFFLANLIHYILVILSLCLTLLLLIRLTYCLSSLTRIMVLVIYVGAIIILIGYICAVCPNNITLNSLKKKPFLYFLITLALSYTFIIERVLTFNKENTLLLRAFYYTSDRFIFLLFLVFFLFLTLLMITTKFNSPKGPFRSIL